MDQVSIVLPRPIFREDSAFSATVYFRDRATQAASVPTNIKYRLDCLTTGYAILDWTTVSAASSATISVTAAQNAILDESNSYENKRLTVAGDYGLSTQVTEFATYQVTNLSGV